MYNNLNNHTVAIFLKTVLACGTLPQNIKFFIIELLMIIN